MSQLNYIIDILNLKEKNIIFKENFYYETKIKGITHKIFEGYLSYQPNCCPRCGIAFDNKFENMVLLHLISKFLMSLVLNQF